MERDNKTEYPVTALATDSLNPQVVCVVNPDEKKRLLDFCSVKGNYLVTPYEMDNWRRDGLSIHSFKENSLYSIHPWRNEYIEINDANEDNVVLERINKIAAIIALLGGKKMQVLSTSIQLNNANKTTTFDIAIDTENLNTGVDAAYSTQIKNSTDTTVSYEIIWTPSTYTRATYNAAVELARKFKLDTDSSIANILNQRHPDHPNQMEILNYEVDVRSDLEQIKNLAIDIKTQLENYNIKANLNISQKKEQHTSRHNTYDFKVEFGPLVLSPEEEEEERKRKEAEEKEKEKGRKEEEKKQKTIEKIKMTVTCVLSAIIIIGLIALFLI